MKHLYEIEGKVMIGGAMPNPAIYHDNADYEEDYQTWLKSLVECENAIRDKHDDDLIHVYCGGKIKFVKFGQPVLPDPDNPARVIKIL